MACCLILYFLFAVVTIHTATALDVPSFPADFHALAYTSGEGQYCPCPSFNEVYQDVTNNRALIVTNEIRSLLVVAPRGAAPGTREEKEMTLFVENKDGSCTYEVNGWPCVMPDKNIFQCPSYFGYPMFNQVGPWAWQMPRIIPKNYAGRDVIAINGRDGVQADKWTEVLLNQQLNSIIYTTKDTITYWMDPSNSSIPLRLQYIHEAINNLEHDWYYQIDFIKFDLGPFPDSVFTPPENWLERCVDKNAGLKINGLPSHQVFYLFAQPNRPANLSVSLYTRPVSKLPVTVTITLCNNSCNESLTCNTDKICMSCVKVSPTKLEFNQENWNEPQEVTMAFDHVGGVGKYQFNVSDNYKIQNYGEHFTVFPCDPENNTPCDCKPL